MKKGRRKLDENVKRTHYVNVAFNICELDLIKERALASKTRTSIFVRQAALNRLPKIVTDFNKDKWIELSRSAANLNQIAHHLNTLSKEQTDLTMFDIREVQLALIDFRNALIN